MSAWLPGARDSVFREETVTTRFLVEQSFNKRKQFRAVATRYDTRDENFLASIQFASIRIWLRHNVSMV